MEVPNGFKLKLVQVLFRHGARSCSKREVDVVNYADFDQSFLPTYGYNQLTNYGKMQAYNLGCAMRDRYNDFLGETYRPDDVYARSSDYDRTKMSMQLVLTGLYPPATHQIWNPDLRWMPIPFHYQPFKSDTLLLPYNTDRYQKYFAEVYNSTAVKEKTLKLKQLIECLIRKKILLRMKKTEKLPLPKWYTNNLFETLKDATVDILKIMSWTTELKKFNGGPLIKQFAENINLNNEKRSSKKIYLYSAHDLNISAFITAHNIDVFEYPDFSSTLILEKFSRNSHNQAYLRMLAWNGKEFSTLKLRNFEDFCPYDEYLKMVEDNISSDEDISSMSITKEENFINMYNYYDVNK